MSVSGVGMGVPLLSGTFWRVSLDVDEQILLGEKVSS